ncbi:MAG: hypothetical protein QM703_02220 [Gemmatales bacterium]
MMCRNFTGAAGPGGAFVRRALAMTAQGNERPPPPGGLSCPPHRHHQRQRNYAAPPQAWQPPSPAFPVEHPANDA